MKNLHDADAFEAILQRLQQLNAATPAQWGMMTVTQMLAHCSRTVEIGTGERTIPRVLLYRIATPVIRKIFYNDKPIPQSIPTDSGLIVKHPQSFKIEHNYLQKKLYNSIEQVQRVAHGHRILFWET